MGVRKKITNLPLNQRGPDYLDLPIEILFRIFNYLDTNDLGNIKQTSKRINRAVQKYKNSCENKQYQNQPSKSILIPYRSYKLIFLILILVPLLAMIPLRIPYNENKKLQDSSSLKDDEIQINLNHIDEINNKYPDLLSPKAIRIIKTRLSIMKNEVSVLMLLGKSRDSHCKLDPTFCVGQTIANVTQTKFGYIDASDPDIHSDEIESELRSSLEGIRYTVMIDSLEKLPGKEVMNLFQYIDRDYVSTQSRRRGMLLFVVYTGLDSYNEQQKLRIKDAEIAERILMESWSPYIPKDSLTSVISRMCGSIVKVF